MWHYGVFNMNISEFGKLVSSMAKCFTYPLYKISETGGYEYSSTATFIKFKNEFFVVFANHALDYGRVSLETIGFIFPDGSFNKLSNNCKSHVSCDERDLCVIHLDTKYEKRCYFDIYCTPSVKNKSYFSWIGFPIKKSIKKIDKTRSSSEKIVKYNIEKNESGMPKFNSNSYLKIDVRFSSKCNENQVVGIFTNKNLKYNKEGFKQRGYSLKGMSGGPFFAIDILPDEQFAFNFVGIGLEFSEKEGLIKGASRNSVLSIIENILESNR